MKFQLNEGAALIFDLDGTLADSMPVWETLADDWLRSLGVEPAPGLSAVLAPLTFTEGACYCIDHYDLDITVESAVWQWQEAVIERYRSKVKFKPGARAFLESCYQAKIPMSIATSCLQAACEAFIEAQNIGHLFQCVLYSDNIGRNKTHPDIFLACAQAMGTPPEKCIVFEDSHFAASGVRAAGMRLIAVYDNHSSNWDELSQAAELAVMDFEELLNLGAI